MLLTIAIPTWNRSNYLKTNLLQLKNELIGLGDSNVEILVSDNCSNDDTPLVVHDIQDHNFKVRYIRNQENIGWGGNFAQCFNLALGKYVLLLGDDDLLVEGSLREIVDILKEGEYGVVCIKPYGFDTDAVNEYPGRGGKKHTFHDPNNFLIRIDALMTMISSCIFNKTFLSKLRTNDFQLMNLAGLHFVITAALKAQKNVYLDKYSVACKRNNSSNYVFCDVFVKEMWDTIEACTSLGLSPQAIIKLKQKLLLTYYPQYILQIRMNNPNEIEITKRSFEARFSKYTAYHICIAPILYLPRYLAIFFGFSSVVVGRICHGDLRRGFSFFMTLLKKRIKQCLIKT